jgi:hypothetical protein
MEATIQITGLNREQATELLTDVGWEVVHHNCHRGYWSRSKVWQKGNDDPVGYIYPARSQKPLTIELNLHEMSEEELERVYLELVKRRG